MDSRQNAPAEQHCVVCFKEVVYCSVGICEHSVCFECSSRMRVLLGQTECPICRQDLEHVIFTKGRRNYRDLKDKLRMFILDPRYQIYMENNEIKKKFEKLLEARCKYCKDGDKQSVFKDFAALRTHVQRVHEVFACDLCVEHIKLFPVERRFYGRADLAHHKRKGDKDDTSFRGHPLCQFCDKRYFDDDDLFKHLRKDHYFCHFCDADGLNQFYNTYDDLRVHFRREHFLCEEENCKDEKFTSVFRTRIDLKAHQASVHSRLLGKHGVRQARQLDVEFNLPPRADQRRARDRERHTDRERESGHNDQSEATGQATPHPGSHAVIQVKSETEINLSDFPALRPDRKSGQESAKSPAAASSGPVSSGGVSSTVSASQRLALSNGLNVSAKTSVTSSKQKQWTNKVSGASRRDEEFPPLGPCNPSSSSSGHRAPSVNNIGNAFSHAMKASSQPVINKKVEVPTKQAVPRPEDFPGLPTSSGQVRGNASAWTGQGIKPRKGQGKLPAPAPVLPGRSAGASSNGHFNDTLQFVPLSYSSEKSKRAYVPKNS